MRSDVSRRFRGGGGNPAGQSTTFPFPAAEPPPPLPPLEIQISRFTRPNGILPFSREHLPEYAPQSSESRSIRSASREVKRRETGPRGGEGRGRTVLANTEIKAAVVFFYSLTLPPLFLALFDERDATGLSNSSG